MAFYRKTLLLLFISILFFAATFLLSAKTYSAQVCECEYWTIEPCNDKVGCVGGSSKCRPGMCRICHGRVCHDDDPPPRCTPISLKCVTYCGFAGSSTPNGCGGFVNCPATGVCPTPVIACVDSDGGSAPTVYGQVSIKAPALPQILTDSCITLNVQTSGAYTTSQWVKGPIGTHVSEKTCLNVATGTYSDTTIACPNQCSNGACNTSAPTPTPTPVYCGPGRPSCPVGQECYQPPMPPCTSTVCAQVMPARYCRISQCPKRPQGDANCDQSITAADYDYFKATLNGTASNCTNCSADFNNDYKTDLLDYEIWRSNFSH